MDDVKQQVVDRLKQANNILVTVRNNPNVDLLSACIGLALVLDKLDKHAAAVFSGEVPSAMEFLKPEETIEQTPNSLRDFIIALDKTKADKLRYKVEDKVVRIFITPYRTSITQEDLDFSQGDFNIDVVVALGAHEQQELDQAITAHGRILHDATIISINNTPNGNLGSLNWQDQGASSISEMVAQLVHDLGKDVLDEQISTALLTGIVAETGRFSNEKTTPRTMTLAGDLMAAGADQQLVANKLQEGGHALQGPSVSLPGEAKEEPAAASDNGTLEIAHQLDTAEPAPTPPAELPKPSEGTIPEAQGRELLPIPDPGQTSGSPLGGDSFTGEFGDDEMKLPDNSFLVDRPSVADSAASGTVAAPTPSPFDLPAPSLPTSTSPGIEPPKVEPTTPVAEEPSEAKPTEPAPAGQTLEEIEASVHSPHLEPEPEPADVKPAESEVAGADQARQNVLAAFQSAPADSSFQRPEPVIGLNANPLGPPLHQDAEPSQSQAIHIDDEGNLKAMDLKLPQPQAGTPPPPSAQPPAGLAGSDTKSTLPPPPPPIEPPMMPFGQ